MAAFKNLKDVSEKFAEELQSASTCVFAAKLGETNEEIIAKKLRDLYLFSAKYQLLHADETSSSPQIKERVLNGVNVHEDYEQAVQTRILEQAVTKSLNMNRTCQSLICTLDNKLEPDMVERKEKLKSKLIELNTKETELRTIDEEYTHKLNVYNHLREEWLNLMIKSKDMRASATTEDNIVAEGPLYDKLKTLVNKMEMMRWLLSSLMTGRNTDYDWLADRGRHINTLKLTRHVNSVASFCEDD